MTTGFAKRGGIIVLTFLFTTMQVQASALSNAFSGLLNGTSSVTTQGGVFAGKMETTITGGGYQINFAPQHTVNLFSFVPPQVNVGCSGISAFTGGLSFVNGKQIQAVLQQISQGVVAGLFLAAVGALCPHCEQWITKIEDWLQKASALAINGCQMGMSIAQDMANTALSAAHHKCVNLAASTNTDSDVFAAKQVTCNGESATSKYVNKLWTQAFGSDSGSTDPTTPNDCTMMQSAVGTGNSTWAFLHNMGAWQTEPYLADLFMSLEGTYVYNTKAAAAVGPPLYNLTPPTINASQFVSIFMCGTDPSSWVKTRYITQAGGVGDNSFSAVFNAMQQTCLVQFGLNAAKGLSLLYCADTSDPTGILSDVTNPDPYLPPCKQGGSTTCSNAGTQSYNGCAFVTEAPLLYLSSVAFPGVPPIGATGFQYYVLNQLAEGVYDIQNNIALPKSVIQLINVSPFPLYKALNIAAVYPSVSADLIATNTAALGRLLALAYVRHEMYTMTKGDNGAPLCVPHGLYSAFRKAQAKLDTEIKVSFKNVNSLYLHEQQIIHSVKGVNQAILDSVYSQGIMSAAFK